MSSLSIFTRGVSRGTLTLFREKQWVTALGALFGVFVLVQLLVLVLTGLEGMQSMLKNRTDLRLEIRETATDVEFQSFYSELSNLEYVRETVFITKEKAFEQTRATDPELIAFLEEFKIENPFSDTIGITLRSLDDYNQLSDFVGQERFAAIIDPTFLTKVTDQEKHVYALLNITRAGRMLTMIILGITAAALIFITTELVRRRAFARSDEVLVERLVGATPFSIVVPFITEAVILLTMSIILSALTLIVLIGLLPSIVPALTEGGILSSLTREVSPLLTTLLPVMIVAELIAAPVIATIGAWLGVRPQISAPRIHFAT